MSIGSSSSQRPTCIDESVEEGDLGVPDEVLALVEVKTAVRPAGSDLVPGGGAGRRRQHQTGQKRRQLHCHVDWEEIRAGQQEGISHGVVGGVFTDDRRYPGDTRTYQAKGRSLLYRSAGFLKDKVTHAGISHVLKKGYPTIYYTYGAREVTL